MNRQKMMLSEGSATSSTPKPKGNWSIWDLLVAGILHPCLHPSLLSLWKREAGAGRE